MSCDFVRGLTNLTTRTIETIPEPTHKFHTRTGNTTDVNFTTDEMDLLNKGLKHNLKNNTTNNNNHNRHIHDLIIDTNTAVQNKHINDQDPIPVSYTHLDVYKRQVGVFVVVYYVVLFYVVYIYFC